MTVFVTTPATSSWSRTSAALIVEPSLPCGTQGLIDDSFLAALPNEDDVIGRPYDSIRNAIGRPSTT